MESFNDNPNPPELPLPDYIVPFDSDHPLPDYKEQLEATATLRGAVEDKVLETMHGLSPKEAHAGVYSRLPLDSFDLNGDPIEIEIHATDTSAHPDLPPYVISLSEGPRQLNGRFMRRHDYSIPVVHSDEGATRRDVSGIRDIKVDLSKLLRRRGDKPITVRSQDVDKIIGEFQRAEERQQQEKHLGLNDQPIGIKEARAVALMISRGQLKVTPPITSK